MSTEKYEITKENISGIHVEIYNNLETKEVRIYLASCFKPGEKIWLELENIQILEIMLTKMFGENKRIREIRERK